MIAIELHENSLPRLAPRTIYCHQGQPGHAVILTATPGAAGGHCLAGLTAHSLPDIDPGIFSYSCTK